MAETGDADPTTLYHAAGVFALSAAATHDDSKQAESYASRALELLRRAFAKGYTNVEQMKKDSDLDPLRQRNDFRKLLAESEQKAKTPGR